MRRARTVTAPIVWAGLVLATTTVPSFGDWGTYQHDLQNTGRSDADWDPRDLEYAWSAPAGFAAPIVQGERVYAWRVVSTMVQYAAFDLRTGQQLWTQSVRTTANQPAVLDGMLVSYDGDRHLRAFDTETGALLHDTVYVGVSSNFDSPALIDLPGDGNFEAYFPLHNGFTKFNITRTASSIAWQVNDQTTGGTPTVAGTSVISTGPGQFYAYQRSDGARNVFYSGPVSGGATSTGLYDAQRQQFYAEETHVPDNNALTAWRYDSHGQISFLWKIADGPRGFSSAALDADGDVWFLDGSHRLREYSPAGQLLRSSNVTFQNGNTPVIHDGYIWVNDATNTFALDLATLSVVQTLPGRQAGGNGFRSVGLIFDDGFLLDRGGGSGSSFDVYFVPEPSSSAAAVFTCAAVLTLARRARSLRRARPPETD